ncbi:MAG TPA: LysR family transcriptional regulator [Gammaproteobacteria bacterium]|nr:LysR family transcriptional regulator [Gammaproteobacteria bacterium]
MTSPPRDNILRHVTLRQLQIFEAVVRLGSYTRAAETLFLTQPTVSMQVRKLEQALDQKLLRKDGRKLILTDAGNEVLALSRSLLQQVESTDQRLRQIADGELGRLNLVVASTVSAVATRLLAEFSKVYPMMQVSFEVTNRAGLIEQLQSHEADIVLMGQPPDHLPIESVGFMENPLVVIAPPDNPMSQSRSPVPLQQLIGHGFVVREPGSGTRMAMERLFNDHGFLLDGSMEVNNNEAIKQAVEVGLGLGVVSVHTLDNELRENRLTVIEAEGFPIIRTWYLVQHRDKRLSPLAQKFRDYVLQQAPLLVTPP